MSVPRPPCTFFQSHLTNQTPNVKHVLQHRLVTWYLTLSLVLDSAVIVVPGLIASYVFAAATGASQHVIFTLMPIALLIIMLGWNSAWLKWHAPAFSGLLWGGTTYIVEEASGDIGLTTEIGVAEHPSISGVVEAVIPGVLFFIRPELRPFKPEYRRAQIDWSTKGITEALNRQSAHRLDCD